MAKFVSPEYFILGEISTSMKNNLFSQGFFTSFKRTAHLRNFENKHFSPDFFKQTRYKQRLRQSNETWDGKGQTARVYFRISGVHSSLEKSAKTEWDNIFRFKSIALGHWPKIKILKVRKPP